MALPIAVLVYFLRGYIVTFIYSPGEAVIAGLLGALTIAILFRSIYFFVARAFYAQQDTRTPLYVSIFAILLNIGLAVWFTMSLGTGPYGLAYAQSIVAFVEVVILLVILSGRVPGLVNRPLLRAIGRMAIASMIMGVIAYIMIQLFQLQSSDKSFVSTFPKFVLIVGISATSYVLLSRVLNLKEADPILARAKRFLFNSSRSR